MFKIIALLIASTSLVSCTAVQMSRAEVDGQLYCSKFTTAEPIIVAVATLTNGPLSAIGMAEEVISAVCASIDAIPVKAPIVTLATPVVTISK